MLKETPFKPIYATGEEEPAIFFLDALINSVSFDLGLGYFSSSGFRALAIGFAFFIKRGGKMRVIINNVLLEEDKVAIEEGMQKSPSEIIEQAIVNDIVRLKDTLSSEDVHFFKCLSWLISTRQLEILATLPKRNKVGIVHQKFGVFKDTAHDSICFTGSANFSASALLNNVEAISCDVSWKNDSGLERVMYFGNLFNKTWKGDSEVVEIIPLEKVKTTIKEHFIVENLDELLDEERALIKDKLNNPSFSKPYLEKIRALSVQLQDEKSKEDAASHPALRDYQNQAVGNWKDNQFTGIFDMATGTGKTFTALACVWALVQETKRLVVIVSCPFIHLAEQWQDEAKKFNLDSILIGDSKDLWENEAARQAQLFSRKKIDLVVFITTNASFRSASFQKIIAVNIHDTLLIIDEVHYAGASSIRQLLPQDCRYRLALSATPERHFDDEGTQALFDYFGPIVFSFPIEKAIGTHLTPYYYRPIPVELTDAEFDEYCSLTEQINRLINRTDPNSIDRLEKLSIKRARVQNNSVEKIHWLKDNISSLPTDYSLFYAGDEIFDSAKQILGKKLKIRIHEFTSRQTRKERKKLLEDFAAQNIQSLIAMKCLDEGVDVPPTRVAYFLASSSNPREFVQRRGRVLRKHPGKTHAEIYDLISIPPKRFINEGKNGRSYTAVKSAFLKEYKRVQEFSKMAINRYESMNKMFTIADQLDLLDTTNY